MFLVVAALVALLIIVGGFIATLGGTAPASPSPSPQPNSQPSGSTAPTYGASPVTSPGPPTADPQGRYPTVDEVRCDGLEHTAFHVHAHLEIRFDGQSQVVPENIGVYETCLYWLHTHRNRGIIHVEAPEDHALTLGTFFEIWGMPLTETQVTTRTATAGESVFVFVNGERLTGDPRTIQLTNLLEIEIQVGQSPLEPLPYEFSPDFL